MSPRLLGDGTRPYDVAAGSMCKLQNLVGDDPNAATNLRFRPHLRELTHRVPKEHQP